MQILKGYTAWVRSVAFSYDSAVLALASGDETIRIWRSDSGECMQIFHLGVTSSTLSFERNTLRLLTDVGAILVHGVTSTCSSMDSLDEVMPGSCSEFGISGRRWITWHDENLLWLPVDVRPSCSAVLGSTVAIGSHSGKVLIIGFSSQGLPDL